MAMLHKWAGSGHNNKIQYNKRTLYCILLLLLYNKSYNDFANICTFYKIQFNFCNLILKNQIKCNIIVLNTKEGAFCHEWV